MEKTGYVNYTIAQTGNKKYSEHLRSLLNEKKQKTP